MALTGIPSPNPLSISDRPGYSLGPLSCERLIRSSAPATEGSSELRGVSSTSQDFV